MTTRGPASVTLRNNSKREDGRENASKEPDVEDSQPTGTSDTERSDQEKPRARTENPDDVRTAGGTRNQEPTEETLRNCHIAGGAWLTKFTAANTSSKTLQSTAANALSKVLQSTAANTLSKAHQSTAANALCKALQSKAANALSRAIQSTAARRTQ
ncbi:hypothetical protein NDU88_011223 [Pleurodeles waltl]|uniref:Uncharacterized protein n=1 Tax=Pleurodeles waltl TaxID=8319 RepID=A0AAV7Q013_PLEWA|nr:hypothetical protein NDU88_011223 [Pleurodeles waltl]